jgi:hypothetical protein
MTMAKYQLRIYRLMPDAMDEFLEVFPKVVEARRAHGMDVVNAWVDREGNRFVWIVTGPDNFEGAVEGYYDSPERQAVKPEPAEFIAEMDTAMVDPAT